MSREETKRLSPYWRRLVTAADKILTRRIEKLEARTVKPEWCLVADDKARMVKQQWEIEGLRDMQKDVRSGGFWGKAVAFEAVLGEKPCLLFSNH